LTAAAVKALAKTPALAGAPWIFQSGDSSRLDETEVRPGLAFPPGTTYDEALDLLYRAVSESGTLPEGTKLVPPLAAGKVLQPPTAGVGLVVDLRAPWGYHSPSGRTRALSDRWHGDPTHMLIRTLQRQCP
jgi:hypothetical protein